MTGLMISKELQVLVNVLKQKTIMRISIMEDPFVTSIDLLS
jgi:hypothetical protein